MLGIIGGTGFASILENFSEKNVQTKYGNPSSCIMIGKIGGTDVALLFRHGLKHQYPPHKIPYRANIAALKEIGVNRIISTSSVGSLKENIKPGDILIPNQLVNFTRREDTFFNGPETIHAPFSDPFCPEIRKIIIEKAKEIGAIVHETGTSVIVEGPRFETRAEIDFYSSHGWDTVNMTQYPEVVLAREMEICYANISIITNYCTGIKFNPKINPLKSEDIPKAMKGNDEKLKNLVIRIADSLPVKRECDCKNALMGARL